MNMMAKVKVAQVQVTRAEAAGLASLAARRVAPMWPLESAIAVNPLSGFEEHAFPAAVKEAASAFGARAGLPLAQWRRLMAEGHVTREALVGAVSAWLGGLTPAFSPLGPDVTPADLMLARLIDLPAAATPSATPSLAPDAALIAKWCAAFFDQRQAAVTLPGRAAGLYPCVLALLPHDPQFVALAGSRGKELALALTRDPLVAVAEGLSELGLHGDEARRFLEALVARLPGWSGHIRWRSEGADADHIAIAPATMADLLALWMVLARAGCLAPAAPVRAEAGQAAALLAHFGLGADAAEALAGEARALFERIANADEAELALLFQMAAEQLHRARLVPALAHAAVAPEPVADPAAQLVFCIDVRSEPFRRAVEATGRYETFGYAGFFGLPIALHPHGASGRRRLLPVLLSPQHDLAEVAVPGAEERLAGLDAAQARGSGTSQMFALAKRGSATAFATAEATGPLAGALMAVRTLFPRLTRRTAALLAPSRAEALTPALDAPRCEAGHARPAFTLEERIGYAMALFRLTGMKPATARIVMLAGHGGEAVNNPYAAALDCGACGGHAGGANARVLAAMLNDPEVRAGLAARGLPVPASTWFVPAEHNTTTDEVTVFDRWLVPETHRADLDALLADLDRAGAANRARRAKTLGRSANGLLAAASDWSEVRPEWGLAGNAAFLVGPREWSAGIDLGGRAFLHSYDWREDEDATALTTILTAPMVVAQWINCQYLFSTIDPERYGSGDKTTHNIVGGLGVVQGNGGDLRIGLPLQSLYRDDGTAAHVPIRLLTVVLAPPARVAEVIARNDILGRLFGNGWVRLSVVDPESATLHEWSDGKLLPASAPLAA